MAITNRGPGRFLTAYKYTNEDIRGVHREGLIWADSAWGDVQWQCGGYTTDFHGSISFEYDVQHRKRGMKIRFDAMVGKPGHEEPRLKSSILWATPDTDGEYTWIGHDYRARTVKMREVTMWNLDVPTNSWNLHQVWQNGQWQPYDPAGPGSANIADELVEAELYAGWEVVGSQS